MSFAHLGQWQVVVGADFSTVASVDVGGKIGTTFFSVCLRFTEPA